MIRPVGDRGDWRKFWLDHSNCGGTWVYFSDSASVVCSCVTELAGSDCDNRQED